MSGQWGEKPVKCTWPLDPIALWTLSSLQEHLPYRRELNLSPGEVGRGGGHIGSQHRTQECCRPLLLTPSNSSCFWALLYLIPCF